MQPVGKNAELCILYTLDHLFTSEKNAFYAPLIDSGMDSVRSMFYPVEGLCGEWHLLKGNKCLQGVLTEVGVAGDKVWHL